MGRHQSSTQEKAEWLAKNPAIWKGWPVGTSDKKIIQAMREAGLVSEGAHDYDVQDLGKVIGQARSVIKRNKAHGKTGR